MIVLNFERTYPGKDRGYQNIRAFACLLVFCLHVSSVCREAHVYAPELFHKMAWHLRGNIGALGVSLFYMLSGALLWRKYKKIDDLKKFYKHQFAKIYVPFWIAAFLHLFLKILIDPTFLNSSYFQKTVFCSLLCLDLPYLLIHDSYPFYLAGEWFTGVLLTMYLFYPLLAVLFSRFRKVSTIVIVLLFTLNLHFQILSYCGGWWSYSNALFFVWIGMLFEEHHNVIVSKRNFLISCFIFVVIFVFFNSSILKIFILPNILCAISLFLILYCLDLFPSLIDRVCELSYEIYLIHRAMLQYLLPCLIKESRSLFIFGFALAVSLAIIVIISELIAFSSYSVLRRIES